MTSTLRSPVRQWVCHVLALAAWLAWTSAGAASQSVLDRSPNVAGGWLGGPGQFHFNFVHRFNHSGAPERQVQNRPTFLLAYTTPWRLLAGAHYSTRSALMPGVPNEWELFARGRPFRGGWAERVGVQVGYNAAARSVDGEVTGTVEAGPVTALAALRGLSADGGGDAAAVLAAAVLLRLGDYVAVAADGGHRFADGEAPWGAALQLRLPTTPHTLSLHVANTDAATLHSASRGSGFLRWGFEFTVPFTPARFRPPPRAPALPAAVADTAGVTVVALHNLKYNPDTVRVRVGTVVEWHNQDPLEHTATSDSGLWDSGPIPPGGRWRRRFDEAGRFGVVCTPHPFMRSVVIVE